MPKSRKRTSRKPDPQQMPVEFPDDHPHIKALVKESRRLNALAENWTAAKPGNPIAASNACNIGWAMAIAAAWLRCYLKGEFIQK